MADENSEIARRSAEIAIPTHYEAEERARWTLNRIGCFLSGPIGKGMAKLTECLMDAAGVKEENRTYVRRAVGTGGALAAVQFGAPEASIAILSSYMSHTPDSPEPAKSEKEGKEETV